MSEIPTCFNPDECPNKSPEEVVNCYCKPGRSSDNADRCYNLFFDQLNFGPGSQSPVYMVDGVRGAGEVVEGRSVSSSPRQMME